MNTELTKAAKIRYGLAAVAAVSGILLAIHRKSGFWGGVGWWIVGGMAGSAIGWVATAGMDETKK